MSFNFETIMSVSCVNTAFGDQHPANVLQAHESAIRAAVWSHSDDWLVSADQDGVIKYWQPNFNNVKAIQGHEAPIRDLAFAPTDSKFVTASDDATLKIWDFSRGSEESTLTGHGWDAKTVDWHPQKGLLVSGSKDHQVKLWDPRTGRCLTTLHGHKNMISKTSFEPIKGQLLATCAKDQTARIFDLRMMRDVLLLKGHERDIMTLTWHPIHSSLLSTGGADGVLHHYLLDEPNQPDGTAATVSPYDTRDIGNAPAQTIFPAHRVPHAHESAIWALDWHPVGHILASGSNDRITRFWTRARPGETECFNDRYHIGDAAAEAQGSWNPSRKRQHNRDEDDQEEEDEEDGLVDQKMPAQRPGLPGLLPGISAIPGMGDGTSTGGAQINMLPGMSGAPPPPGMIPQDLAAMFAAQGVPPPMPGFPPPPPGYTMNGMPIPPPGSMPPPGMLPPGYPGMPVPPPFADPQAMNGATPDPRGGRRRAPLPSQQDSLKEELKRGNNFRPY